MKNYHYTFYFTETNKRLEEKKNRSRTFELSEDYYNQYDVSGLEKEFYNRIKFYTGKDSNIVLKRIKIGKTIFQL